MLSSMCQLRVLVVEDHPFQLFAHEAQFNALGLYMLAQAMDLSAALKILNAGRKFDLLLCDQYLSDGFGFDLIVAAHKIGAIKSAVLLSGVDDASDRQRILSTAAKLNLPLLAYLPKPLAMSELKKVVEEIQVINGRHC